MSSNPVVYQFEFPEAKRDILPATGVSPGTEFSRSLFLCYSPRACLDGIPPHFGF